MEPAEWAEWAEELIRKTIDRNGIVPETVQADRGNRRRARRSPGC
ncbi:hypothetical protein [Streptomyces sp. NPDC087437]